MQVLMSPQEPSPTITVNKWNRGTSTFNGEEHSLLSPEGQSLCVLQRPDDYTMKEEMRNSNEQS